MLRKISRTVTASLLTASLLLAACTPAPTPAPTATEAAPTAAAEATPENPPTGGETDEQKALRNRWHTNVVAAFYPWLVCESAQANISGEETTAEREATAVNIATLANAGLEVLAQWEPPEEFAGYRSESLAHLSVLIETAGRWYKQETDNAAFQAEMDELCRSIGVSLQERTDAARAEGLSEASLETIIAAFQQSLGQ